MFEFKNMKKVLSLLLLIFGLLPVKAQLITQNNEQFPVFSECQEKTGAALEKCFYNSVQDFVFNNFKVPQNVAADFKGNIIVLFEVDVEGNFKPIYVDATNEEISQEAKRVFGSFPKVFQIYDQDCYSAQKFGTDCRRKHSKS